MQGKQRTHVLKAEKLARLRRSEDGTARPPSARHHSGSWPLSRQLVRPQRPRSRLGPASAPALPPLPLQAGPIDCDKCKTRVSAKNKKLVVTLRKAHQMSWGQLRANVCLPYRRGGGGH